MSRWKSTGLLLFFCSTRSFKLFNIGGLVPSSSLGFGEPSSAAPFAVGTVSTLEIKALAGNSMTTNPRGIRKQDVAMVNVNDDADSMHFRLLYYIAIDD
jgi:hypothetical protein